MTSNNVTLEQFLQNPWKNEVLHEAYKESFLDFSNMPEYGPSEMLLASLYRRVGVRLQDGSKKKILPESEVGKRGTSLKRKIEKSIGRNRDESLVSAEGWQRVVSGIIRSPKTPKQGKSNFIQTTPIVPQAAIYSMAARLRGHPWNPGALIESSLCYGGTTENDVNKLWREIFDALTVDPESDDGWAVYLEQEFSEWRDDGLVWDYDRDVQYQSWMDEWQKDELLCPARRFYRDMGHALSAKPLLSRRQWCSIVEATLRIGLSSHVLWMAKVNGELFAMAEEVMRGGMPPDQNEISERLSTSNGFWSYGQLIGKHIKKLVRKYVYGRLGINMLLHRAGAIDGLKDCVENKPFSSVEKIHEFLAVLHANLGEFNAEQFRDDLDVAMETDPRRMAIKYGTGKNLEEFLRHALGQRETQERGLEGYDQGYLLSRRGTYARAPWVLEAGPVMILALVNACEREGKGIRTVEDFCKHLSEYGIKMSPDEVADSRLGVSLRTLGLVLDSPDAEGGMVLLNPFGYHDASLKK